MQYSYVVACLFPNGLSSLLIVLFAVYLICLLVRLRKKQPYSKHPPGPMPLPIIGNLHQFGSKPHERLTEFAKTFGDVYSLQLGSHRAIVLNSLNCVKETLVKKPSDYSSRPPLASFKASDQHGRSVAFGPYGPTYVKNRRLAQLAMHSFLSDHERLYAQLTNGVQRLCKKFSEHDQEFDPIFDIKNAVAEMNFEYTFGEDVDAKDKDHLSRLLKESAEFIETNKVSNMVDFMPWLTPLLGGSIKRLQYIVDDLVSFVRKIYNKKKDTFCKKSEVRCVADSLIRCYEHGTSESVVAHGEELDLNEENVVVVLTDIFGASCATTSLSLAWAVLYVAANANIQERLYKEMSDVVGNNPIGVDDKARLPLLEATILETLRLSSTQPFGIPHFAQYETSVGPYIVPQETIVLVNLWAINHDERVFKDAFNFDPERFIDQSGKINNARFSCLPFSAGTRKCLGHVLAHQQLFLLVGGLIQKYKLEVCGSHNFSPVFGFMLSPEPFKIKVTERE